MNGESRFNEDTAASYTRVSAPSEDMLERRRSAEERAYRRWEQELKRKYRAVEGESVGAGDEIWLETKAQAEDWARLRELVAEELINNGVR